jgi:hypothetical protein
MNSLVNVLPYSKLNFQGTIFFTQRKVLVRWLPIMNSWRKDKQSWMLSQARTHSWQWLLKNLSVSCRMNQFLLCNYSYVVHIIGTKQPKVNQSPQLWRGRYTCTRIYRFLVVGNIFWLETCMNSLVKVLPYSKLNFQGTIFFTQNWCNITIHACFKSKYVPNN